MDLVRRSSARPTGLAIVLVEPDRESTIIVDSGANGLLGPDDVPPTYASGVVLAQLGVPAATVGAALTSARVAGARSVLSTSPLVPGSERLVDMADIVACDRVEAMRWTVEAPKLCTAVQLSTSACMATLVGPGRTCHRYPGPLQDLGLLNCQPGVGVGHRAVSLGGVVEHALVEIAGPVAARRELGNGAEGPAAFLGHDREGTHIFT